MSTKGIQKKFLTVLATLFVFYMGWFLYLYITQTTSGGPANIYSNTYGIIPLIGGIYGFLLARRWGGFSSAVGRAVSFLSLGLITWGFGMVIWLYYNIILGVSVPYPSWADASFVISWPLWAIGIINLSRATGAKFELRKMEGKILLFVIPAVIIAISYYLLVVVARGGVLTMPDSTLSPFMNQLKLFFDLAYPIGDVVILSLSILIYGLSFKYFGGLYRTAIYIVLAGFIANYFADFTFSYTTTLTTYYNGSLADVLFTMTMTLLSMGIVLLDPRQPEEKNPNT